MGRIDLRWLRAARLAGATLVAVGAFDVVLRGHSLSRDEDGAILLAAGAALLALHVVLARSGPRDSTDALLAAALAVPFIPAGVALLAYSPPSAASLFESGGDLLSPFRDAASAGLFVGALAFAGAYALTRQPRWVLVVALSVGFGAELQSAAPIPIFGTSTDSWTPAVILAVSAAVAVAVAWKVPREAERRNLVVAAAIMLAAAAEARAFGGSADAGRDLFLAGLLAAGVAIAWWRATPGIAVAVIFTSGVLTLSLSQRSGYFGVGAVLVGVALAGGATFWSVRSANGGGPPALPPAPAA
jgi:hypothetical protein